MNDVHLIAYPIDVMLICFLVAFIQFIDQVASLCLSDLKYTEIQIERARLMSPGKFSLGKKKPDCFLNMVLNLGITQYI